MVAKISATYIILSKIFKHSIKCECTYKYKVTFLLSCYYLVWFCFPQLTANEHFILSISNWFIPVPSKSPVNRFPVTLPFTLSISFHVCPFSLWLLLAHRCQEALGCQLLWVPRNFIIIIYLKIHKTRANFVSQFQRKNGKITTLSKA